MSAHNTRLHATSRLPQAEDRQWSAAAIRSQFPGVTVWYGHRTRRCWAYVPRLGPEPDLRLSALTFDELAYKIADVRGVQW